MKYDSRDTVTGLLDREAFLRVIDDVVEDRGDEYDTFSVLVLDVDRSRLSFGVRGAQLADRLTRMLAERVEDLVASAGVVARLGATVFGVLPHGAPDDRDVVDLPARLHKMLRAPFEIDGEEVCVTTSIGVAVAPARTEGVSRLLRVRADAALYVAKHNGRDRVELWQEGQATRASETRGTIGDP